jgi:ABC-2 type transport system ATP-binding protein
MIMLTCFSNLPDGFQDGEQISGNIFADGEWTFMESKPIILTQDLSFNYGKNRGIEGVSLNVHQGEVFGFLGPNGAGKTTTLRILMDILHPASGSAFIFGMDCQSEGAQIRRQVGYLPGELSLYERTTGKNYLDFINGMYRSKVDPEYKQNLIERFEFDPDRPVHQYSRGNKQKLGLIAALMHRPDLLILDEPTSGLDPLMQKVVLDLVKEAQREGRTVFFSSHNLYEVQAVCDRVGIIRQGHLTTIERVDHLISLQYRRLRLVLAADPAPEAFRMEGVNEVSRMNQEILLEVQQEALGQVLEAAGKIGVLDLETQPVTLEEIFFAYYGNGNNA